MRNNTPQKIQFSPTPIISESHSIENISISLPHNAIKGQKLDAPEKIDFFENHNDENLFILLSSLIDKIFESSFARQLFTTLPVFHVFSSIHCTSFPYSCKYVPNLQLFVFFVCQRMVIVPDLVAILFS